MKCEPKVVLFDFGGVYYTEGFREGIFAIAGKYGKPHRSFLETAVQVTYATGYVRGEIPEAGFWEELGKATGLDVVLYPERETILQAFKPIPGMGALVARIKEGTPVGLLTDQTNWLYELDERDGFLSSFHEVVSSYEEGFTKKDPEFFRIACQRMDVFPGEVLFFDDNMGNVTNAREFGMRAFLFEDTEETEKVLKLEGVID
ncbi:MAG: HAD family phosphatase [Proteobacteria bacterium]|nr:HAD family phosphatase [Pseudomonadota bacterium]